jgi:5-methylcytosine-specific restriction endonuclease McrA
MARKRMISPEFWTDATMVALPFEARLLYIGMWNFADDYGYLADEPERLALQILPADSVDVEGLIDLLVVAERLARYEADDGSRYLHIRHFTDHQRVDHPTRSAYAEREGSRKLAIPNAVRRAVATKYGCPPGGEVDVDCYYCGVSSRIRWWPGRRGQAGCWVTFGRLELDHFQAESTGGAAVPENLVLACQPCNRSKGPQNGVDFVSRNGAIPREPSRIVASVPESRAPAEVSLSQVSPEEVRSSKPLSDESGAAPAALARAAPKPKRTDGWNHGPLIDAFRAAGLPDPVLAGKQESQIAQGLLRTFAPTDLATAWAAIVNKQWGDQYDRDRLSFAYLADQNRVRKILAAKARDFAPEPSVSKTPPMAQVKLGSWSAKGYYTCPCGRQGQPQPGSECACGREVPQRPTLAAAR